MDVLWGIPHAVRGVILKGRQSRAKDPADTGGTCWRVGICDVSDPFSCFQQVAKRGVGLPNKRLHPAPRLGAGVGDAICYRFWSGFSNSAVVCGAGDPRAVRRTSLTRRKRSIATSL